MTDSIPSATTFAPTVTALADAQLDDVSGGFEWFPIPPAIHSRG